ncbi:MAG TPA: hypothetical protein VFW15_08875, partial [Thermoanaerobaculia bacterium]|nr:hypothetical protein [Thermoanaerobaculia bacterium]
AQPGRETRDRARVPRHESLETSIGSFRAGARKLSEELGSNLTLVGESGGARRVLLDYPNEIRGISGIAEFILSKNLLARK